MISLEAGQDEEYSAELQQRASQIVAGKAPTEQYRKEVLYGTVLGEAVCKYYGEHRATMEDIAAEGGLLITCGARSSDFLEIVGGPKGVQWVLERLSEGGLRMQALSPEIAGRDIDEAWKQDLRMGGVGQMLPRYAKWRQDEGFTIGEVHPQPYYYVLMRYRAFLRDSKLQKSKFRPPYDLTVSIYDNALSGDNSDMKPAFQRGVQEWAKRQGIAEPDLNGALGEHGVEIDIQETV